MKNIGFIGWICSILMIVGSINWGLIGIFHWNVIGMIFGYMTISSRAIYIITGLAGVYMLHHIFSSCKCKKAE